MRRWEDILSKFGRVIYTLNSLLTHILFYSGHCKKLDPEYSAAAKILAEQEPPKSIAKVDATENKELAERFGIQGFPTLHWFV